MNTHTREIKKLILERIKKKKNFSVSAESRFGGNNYEVYHIDFNRKSILIDYSEKKEWIHCTRIFKIVNVLPDKDSIKLTIRLMPESQTEYSKNEVFFDFLSTGRIIKVI